MAARKTVGKKEVKEIIDFKPLMDGFPLLKCGRSGDAKEKIFTLTKDKKMLKYTSSLFSWKLGAVVSIKFDDVVRIQKGQKTYPFQRLKKLVEDLESTSLSIIYNSEGKETSLDLCTRGGDFDHIYKALKALWKECADEKSSKSADELYVKKMFEKADADVSGTLSKREVIDLIMSMNINMKQEVIRDFYEKVDADNNGVLSLDEFHVLMDLLRTRPELEYIWTSVVENNYMNTKDFQPFDLLKTEDDSWLAKQHCVSLETFVQFYNHTQAPDSITSENAVTMLTSVLNRPYTASEPITYYTWSQFMLSIYNDAFDPAKGTVYQDMTKSLSLYYMASSHNTYLEGDQLTSKSSVNRYIDDLLLGCRCVELDCWDGEKEPIIYHGHTLTSKITFGDVCAAINEVGFKKSPYPIVLSIENHCSLAQQEMLAKIMKGVFKESLLSPMGSAYNLLPSPDALKYKILVKGKRSHDNDTGAEDDEEEEEEDGSESSNKDGKKKIQKSESKKKVKHDIHPALCEITFLSTGKVKQFNATTNALSADQMCSYSEITTTKYTKKPEVITGWINHNKKHLSRIYPKGTRVDSSNYNPTIPWSAGNQLVALNYQTHDTHYRVNYGKFRENGMCGYVLKPQYMITDSTPARPIVLSIHVISASQLPKPGGKLKGEIIDPFVTVQIHGVRNDEKVKSTEVIDDNGFNPIWNKVFTFSIEAPECAVLTFDLMDKDVTSSDFIAFASIPVSCIRNGVRNIPLCEQSGRRERDFMFASLLVRICATTA